MSSLIPSLESPLAMPLPRPESERAFRCCNYSTLPGHPGSLPPSLFAKDGSLEIASQVLLSKLLCSFVKLMGSVMWRCGN